MDIVIVASNKDFQVLIHGIPSIQKYIKSKHIYIITNDVSQANIMFGSIENISIIDETIFPFKYSDIEKYVPGVGSRAGWYLQQFLKLYAGNVLNLSEYYLVIDADVVFYSPISFFNNNCHPIYTMGSEHHHPYFDHMNRLHPSLTKIATVSGITHHMVFNRNILNELFE